MKETLNLIFFKKKKEQKNVKNRDIRQTYNRLPLVTSTLLLRIKLQYTIQALFAITNIKGWKCIKLCSLMFIVMLKLWLTVGRGTWHTVIP